MSHRKIVEELAEVRAQIDRLRLRERELCAALLRAPEPELSWPSHQVPTARDSHLSPTLSLLPDDVRTAPQVHQGPGTTRDVAEIGVVRTLTAPRFVAQSRPGWPIRREVAAH